MLLKKLIIENIRSYEKQEIEFPKGSILLSGDIGSGKTTILLAIEFALFGLQPSQKASSLLRNGTEKGRIVLNFEIEGKDVIIERTLKKNKSISQDYASITIDNEKFEGSITEVKTKVLELLNYPREFAKKTNLLYKFTVYTPQEEMKQIILETGDIRLNTLRHVFGIDKYKRIEENTMLFSSKLRERIRLNQGRFYDFEDLKNNLEEKQNLLLQKKEEQKKEINNYEIALKEKLEKEKSLKEIQEKQNEKLKIENEKSKTEVLISEKKQQLVNLKISLKNLYTQIKEFEKISFNQNTLNSIKERIKFQEDKQNELQKEYIQIIGKINSLDSKIKESNSLNSRISQLHKCPTCLQDIPEEYKKNISNKINEEINEINKTLKNLFLEKQNLIQKIEESKETQKSLNKQKDEQELLKLKLENLNDKKKQASEIEIQISSLNKDLELLKKHLIDLETSIKEFSKYDLIYMQREEELKKAKEKENILMIKKTEIIKEVEFLEHQIKEIDKEIKEKDKLKQETEKLKEIEDWISSRFLELVLFTEKQVLIRLKEEFSNLFTKWFSILVSDSLTAKLDDEFSPIIEQQDYELDYSFLSGGEKTAIALAYRLALNQVINTILSKIKTNNLVILDEPTDGFSSQQLDKMRDVLSQLNAEQLIIVSHEAKIEGFVDNIIRIKKENGITKVEE